ncbi:hypothetical protein [Marinococcus halotolerans]|uniref:hypothetical protein n=1 Tax=Marinococcus halotolerans TaxID=301092 RepID=UPI0003B75677|nr:hypothetical protein [Marinococcus halotolerans]
MINYSINTFFNNILKAQKETQEALAKELKASYKEGMLEVRNAMEINMFEYNWAMTENMTSAKYKEPYLQGWNQSQTDDFFINYFSDEKVL